jgi:L-threonylcarbamoyladenylate synthase
MADVLSTEIKKQVEKGIIVLKNGGVVAFPTDTIYGLGCSIYHTKAVERIFIIKERPRHMALPILLANTGQIKDVAAEVPPIAWQLAERFLPGGLTLVLKKSASVPDVVTVGGDTVAVRIPSHPVPVALIEGTGAPLVGTSANISGMPNPLTAEDVRSQLGDKVDLIIDGGGSPGGIESTVVDVTGKFPRILREGAITREELEKSYKGGSN